MSVSYLNFVIQTLSFSGASEITFKNVWPKKLLHILHSTALWEESVPNFVIWLLPFPRRFLPIAFGGVSKGKSSGVELSGQKIMYLPAEKICYDPLSTMYFLALSLRASCKKVIHWIKKYTFSALTWCFVPKHIFCLQPDKMDENWISKMKDPH